MKVKVDGLAGRALAWAVIRAMGHAPLINAAGVSYKTDHGSWYSPRVNDAEAVELMEEHWIGLERPSRGQNPPQWRALAEGQRGGVVDSWSRELALAVHRCYVKSRFGEQIEVPKELLDALNNPRLSLPEHNVI